MTSARQLTRVVVCLTLGACALPAFATDAIASQAQPGNCGARAYSATQGRIVEHAVQGPDALRRYVGIVQPLQQIDYADAVAWLDAERERLQACRMAALRDMTAKR